MGCANPGVCGSPSVGKRYSPDLDTFSVPSEWFFSKEVKDLLDKDGLLAPGTVNMSGQYVTEEHSEGHQQNKVNLSHMEAWAMSLSEGNQISVLGQLPWDMGLKQGRGSHLAQVPEDCPATALTALGFGEPVDQLPPAERTPQLSSSLPKNFGSFAPHFDLLSHQGFGAKASQMPSPALVAMSSEKAHTAMDIDTSENILAVLDTEPDATLPHHQVTTESVGLTVTVTNVPNLAMEGTRAPIPAAPSSFPQPNRPLGTSLSCCDVASMAGGPTPNLYRRINSVGSDLPAIANPLARGSMRPENPTFLTSAAVPIPGDKNSLEPGLGAMEQHGLCEGWLPPLQQHGSHIPGGEAPIGLLDKSFQGGDSAPLRKCQSAVELMSWRARTGGTEHDILTGGTGQQLLLTGAELDLLMSGSTPQVCDVSGGLVSSSHRAVGAYNPEERAKKLERYRQKRYARNFRRTVKYQCRKQLADSRPRVKGRFARNEDPEAVMPHESKKAQRERLMAEVLALSSKGQPVPTDLIQQLMHAQRSTHQSMQDRLDLLYHIQQDAIRRSTGGKSTTNVSGKDADTVKDVAMTTSGSILDKPHMTLMDPNKARAVCDDLVTNNPDRIRGQHEEEQVEISTELVDELIRALREEEQMELQGEDNSAVPNLGLAPAQPNDLTARDKPARAPAGCSWPPTYTLMAAGAPGGPPRECFRW